MTPTTNATEATMADYYARRGVIPSSPRDADGHSYQQRRLDDGSTHEVLKNFPVRDEAFALLGPRAREPRWTESTYYWTLAYELH